MDEQRAIQLCVKHRDPVGFEFLEEKYRREAFLHASALLGNQEDALDACQDAFVKAFMAIPRLAELPRFYPWFYSILRNHCLNLIAKRQTSERYREAEQQDATRPVDALTPGSLLEAREEQRLVRQALNSLKPEHREILVLKYVQELHYDEIAELLAIPRGTVMSRLYHARMAMRQQYANLDGAAAQSLPEQVT